MTTPQGSWCAMPVMVEDERAITNETYIMQIYEIERIALALVKWKGLPIEIHEEMLERYLFYYGKAAFFYDDILEKYLVLPVTAEYDWDENGFPTDYEVHGFREYRKRLTVDDSVIIYNNYSFLPSAGNASLFASRLTQSLRVGDVHLEAHKIGKIIAVPDTMKKSVQTILQRIKNFVLYTIVSPITQGLNTRIEEINGQPEDYVLDKIDNHYTFVWHEVLNYFGVDSLTDKKSGMSTEEITAETGRSSINGKAIIKPRQEAAEKINQMFGLNIKPELEGEIDLEQLYNNTAIGNGERDREESGDEL